MRSFDLDEIRAYSRVLDVLEMHTFECGYFLLETHHKMYAELVTTFVRNLEAALFS